MAIEIDRFSIKKLGHESLEIRLRTLEQIENKVLRALTHTEGINFHPGELMKYLIKWFAFQPLQAIDNVLKLILTILRSPYRQEVVDYLGEQRLKKELDKVKVLIKSTSAEVQFVGAIFTMLGQNDMSGKVIQDSNSSDSIDSLTVGGYLDRNQSQDNNISYETVWSKPSIPDFNSMKGISDILKRINFSSDLHNALQHIQIIIGDYPAEYFLQPPYIFLDLLDLFEGGSCCFEDLSETLICFCKSLFGRLQTRRKAIAYCSPSKQKIIVVKTQVTVSTVCFRLLELCITYIKFNISSLEKGNCYVFQMIMEVFRIIEILPTIESPVIEMFFKEMESIAKKFRISFKDANFPIMNRVQYILILFIIKESLRCAKSSSIEANREIKIALLDLPLSKLFPEQYMQFQKMFEHNIDLNMRHLLKASETLKFYTEEKQSSDLYVLEQSLNVLQTFEIHESVELIEKIFKAIVDCVPLYAGNQQLRKKSNTILQQMLCHHNIKVKIFTYRESAKSMKRFFACLLNGECAFTGQNNFNLVDSHILGIPLTTEFFAEIAIRGFEDNTLRTFSEDIILLPIKGRPILEESWPNMLEIILPNIPLYQCLTESQKITDALLKLLDPDANWLPRLYTLQGNLRFLFHPNVSIRTEALSRTIYILTSQSGASSMLPNLMEISDIIPNDCCLLGVPQDIELIFCGGNYDPLIVPNLMQILRSEDVEPHIRNSVFMQLNVLGKAEHLNRIIFDAGGWMTSMQSLQFALQKPSHSYFPDLVLPIVGILSKLLFCDGQFRQELAKEETIYILLTRSLFLYVNDKTLKQDAALCLFLLLFSSFIVGTKNVTVPKILQNIGLPVKCETQTASSGKKSLLERFFLGEEGLISSFADQTSIIRFLRMTIADLRFSGGLLMAKTSTEYSPSLSTIDIRLIKATSMSENISKFLKNASKVTDQKQIVGIVTSLRLIQLLNDGSFMNSDLLTKTFRRFILNSNQLVIFEELIELFSSFVQVNNETIINWLLSTLAEEHTPLLRLLSNEIDTPLSLHRKICALISAAFKRAPPSIRPPNLEINIFKILMSITEEHFKLRDLDRTRCVLGVLQVISGRRSLQIFHRKQVYTTLKKLFYFAIALKTFNQTGSDLQKSTLLIISSLLAITNEIRLTGAYLKFLSGLGGHNDYQVRTLAWCILARIAKSDNGVEAMIKELDFLPGGFQSCCLSTLLDVEEVAMIRQLAGLLFANLINSTVVHEIIKKHDFYRVALASLQHFYPEGILLYNDNNRKEITTCDIVRAYCKICIKLIELKSSFCAELCNNPLMGKLYQLVKFPPTIHGPQKSFVSMVAEICNLYLRYSPSHLAFLKTTLCRDHVFLRELCSFLCTSHPQQHLISIFNLLMVLSKDQTSFQYICEIFAERPEIIVNLVTGSLDTSSSCTLLQPTCLAFITFLLINSRGQNVEFVCFSHTLENMLIDSEKKKYATQVLFLQLNKLLIQNNTGKNYKFDNAPSTMIVLLCEAMAVLLRTSEKARIMAKNTKFLDIILSVINLLSESIELRFNTFVRYPETKKMAVIKHFKLYYSIILNWFSVDVLADELQVIELTKAVIQTWSWQTQSNDLRILYLKTLAFLSEKSTLVCRQFSVSISEHKSSLLQMLLKYLITETNKVKNIEDNSIQIIEIGLRIITNCCSCQEGRIALIKLHALDVFDALHPFYPKSPRSKNDIFLAWLSFWELFSRYPEGAGIRNIIGLCTVINKCHDGSLRLIGLKILRNMTFLPSNRTNLLASADFLFTVSNIITNSECYSQLLVMCTALWRLISGGAKYAATIKNTNITNKLNKILNDLYGRELQKINEKRSKTKDLASVIEIIFKILNS